VLNIVRKKEKKSPKKILKKKNIGMKKSKVYELFHLPGTDPDADLSK
jgi:hypothetical protein